MPISNVSFWQKVKIKTYGKDAIHNNINTLNINLILKKNIKTMQPPQ